jgi:hypothetical protein
MMKKLNKLIINPEKVIKNEELVNLKGGTYADLCGPGTCYCCTTSAQGGVTQCSNSLQLSQDFCAVWQAGGDDCECETWYYV